MTRSPVSTPRSSHPGRALLGAVLAVLLTAAGAMVAGAPGAAAHSDEGEVQFDTIEMVGSDEVRVSVFVTYVNDGHAAAPATIDLTATGPDGSVVGPLAMAPGTGEGAYEVQFPATVPGDWALHVESTAPAAVADTTTPVGPPAAAETDTTGPSTGESGDEAGAGEIGAAPTVTGVPPAVIAESGNDPPVALIVGVVVFGLLAAGGVFLLLRSRRAAAGR